MAATCYRDLVLEGSSVCIGGQNSKQLQGSSKAAFITKLFESSVTLSNQLTTTDSSSKNQNIAHLIKQKVS
jgi:hypothetical protein